MNTLSSNVKMNFLSKEPSIEQYKKLGFRELEQLYTERMIPFLSNSLETACLLLESEAEKQSTKEHLAIITGARKLLTFFTAFSLREVALFSVLTTGQVNAGVRSCRP